MLAALPTLELPPAGTRLVVLAAHPDDETLGVGGILHAWPDASVEVIVASDGEASHPRSPTHSPEQLRAIRRREARIAIGQLCPSAAVTFLGLPDGSLAAHRDTITAAVRTAVPDGPVWLLAPWREDRHPDHEACAIAARTLDAPEMRRFEYPIWAWHWATPESDDLPVQALRRVVVDASASRTALQSYVSQLEPLSDLPGDEAIVSAALVAQAGRPLDVVIEVTAGEAPVDPAFFDRLYAAADDPWDLAGRWYERRKRAILLASLPRERFRRVFEPGCAMGLLTAELASRADHVLATDVADRAIAQARDRAPANVEIRRLRIPDLWPDGRFDLVVLSEVGYYCADLGLLAARVRAALTNDGTVVLCHWRHAAGEHPHTAEEVHAAVGTGLSVVARHVERDFLLEVLATGNESVAEAEGIV